MATASVPVAATNNSTTSVVAASGTSTMATAPIASSSAAMATSTLLANADLTLPYDKSDFTNNVYWQATWGTMFVSPAGTMDMVATSTGTGASIALAGSANWTDYKFEAKLDWRGEMFGLTARAVDSQNYVLCAFDEQNLGAVHVVLQQFVNGNASTLATGDILNYDQPGGTDVDAYINVHGTTADCSLNNHIISSAGSSGGGLNPPFSGGIGIVMWDPVPGTSALTIKSVDVESNH
jgi:hypothetical protein